VNSNFINFRVHILCVTCHLLDFGYTMTVFNSSSHVVCIGYKYVLYIYPICAIRMLTSNSVLVQIHWYLWFCYCCNISLYFTFSSKKKCICWITYLQQQEVKMSN